MRLIRLRRSLAAGGAALALTALTVARGCAAPSASRSVAERSLLTGAGLPARPIEARLSGMPFSPPLLSPVQAALPDPRQLARLERALRRSPEDSSALDALAVLDLCVGRQDEAISRLERAAARVPGRGDLLSDLAAAYLARGDTRLSPQDLVRALALLEQALQADPGLLATRFNRALAMEKLCLVAQARGAWREYLHAESSGGWAREARAHLERLADVPESEAWPGVRRELLAAADLADSRRIVSLAAAWRRQSRRLVEEELLGQWAHAWVAGQSAEAAIALARARGIGAALRSLTGDGLAIDAVGVVDRELRQGDKGGIGKLATGHAAVAEGLVLAGEGRDGDARSAFRRGAALLAVARSPFAGFAEFKEALATQYQGRYLEALEELAGLERRTDLRRFPTLAAGISWIGGLAHLKLAHYARALELYRRALARFSPTGERESLAALHSLLGECLRLQGGGAAAWDDRWKALALSHDLDLSPWYHNALFDAAEAALDEHEPRLALVFHGEMIERAKRTRDPVDVVESLVRRSRDHVALGDRESAGRDLQAAAAWSVQLPDGARRRSLQADIAAMWGEALIPVDARTASRKLGEAISFFTALGAALRLPELYRAQAVAYGVAGERDRAEESLARGIAEVERAGGTIADLQLGIDYFEQVRSLYAEMIQIQIEVRGVPDQGFAYLERYRAAVLRAGIAGKAAESAAAGAGWATSGSMGAEAVRRRLPENAALLAYAVLPGKVVAWCLTARGVSFAVLGTTGDLVSRIAAFRDKLREPRWDADGARRAGDLYRLLLGPFRIRLAAGAPVVIVPDGELSQIPFAALIDPASGRYLIEDYTVGYALSATRLVASVGNGCAPALSGGRPASALAVGDPAFDGALFPDLARLPAAAVEAREVAALYPRADLLVGGRATRSAFLRGLQGVDVVHVASHAVVDLRAPARSGFVLAPEGGQASGGDTGFLSAAELSRVRRLAARVVVLGSCSTADTGPADKGLVSGLVRPFLAAGAPVVIGSLWPVPDEAGRRLLVAVHRRLSRGEGAADALRAAQLLLVADPDPNLNHPASWAGFQATGAILPPAARCGGNHGR